ncbi:MAG: outer membrane lipoprotein-sorting protein [Campylobacterota bacterium]|nr:outer membrane lipoprotein-sorting protein [Campylobacterota bacterium]
MLKYIVLPLFVTYAWAISNYEVAQKSDAVMSGYQDAVSEMQMTLVNANGQERVRQMTMQVLEKDGGDKSLMEFLSPADVKGTKFLSYEHAEKDDDQWLYLPALKRVKRIASRNKSGSFMGSEFAYEDLSAFNIDKYSYEGEAEEIVIEGKKIYRTVRVPKSKNSGYTSQMAFVDRESFLTIKVDYYDRKRELLKTATFFDYKKIDGIWRIGKIKMKNHQNDKETILIWKNETIKNGLSDKDFHKRMLK